MQKTHRNHRDHQQQQRAIFHENWDHQRHKEKYRKNNSQTENEVHDQIVVGFCFQFNLFLKKRYKMIVFQKEKDGVD